MPQWIEVSIQTTHEAADLVAEIMRAAGANNGVVIDDPVLINTQALGNYAIFLSRKTQKWLR